MKHALVIIIILSCAWLGAIGRDEPEPQPEPAPAPVMEQTPDIPTPIDTTPPDEVVKQEPQPTHEFSLVFNGINRYNEAPTIARINIGPRTTATHSVQLNAWFEVKVGEDEWYSIMDLVELIR